MSSIKCVKNGSGAHPASYPLVPGALSLGVKRPGCEAVPPLPNTPSRRAAQLKHRDNFAFLPFLKGKR